MGMNAVMLVDKLYESILITMGRSPETEVAIEFLGLLQEQAITNTFQSCDLEKQGIASLAMLNELFSSSGLEFILKLRNVLKNLYTKLLTLHIGCSSI